MPNIYLTAYTVRLIDKNTGQRQQIHNFFQGQDLFTVMRHYLNLLENEPILLEDAQKSFRITRNVPDPTNRKISGIAHNGDYGYSSEIRNIQTNEVTYNRTIEDAELLPFYFLVHLPRGANEGVLVLQRFGVNGIKTVFTDYFREIFSEVYPDTFFDIYPLTPQSVIDEVINNGRFTKIRFIRHGVPTDIADIYSADGDLEEEGYFEQSIQVKRKGSLRIGERLTQFLNGQRPITAIYELPYDYETVKVEVELNGRYRTIDLAHLERFRANYDISDEVEMGANGHPTFESIDSSALRLLDDLTMTIGNQDDQ